MELARFLRKPSKAFIVSSLVLQRPQVRAFATKKSRAKSKAKPRAKRKASKKIASIDVDVLSKNLHPFYPDKGQQTLPTRPILTTPNIIEKDGTRFYRVRIGDENCTFPSVTNVLSHTLPVSSTYAMKMWYQKQVKELGEEGVKEMEREGKTQGANFHKVNVTLFWCLLCSTL